MVLLWTICVARIVTCVPSRDLAMALAQMDQRALDFKKEGPSFDENTTLQLCLRVVEGAATLTMPSVHLCGDGCLRSGIGSLPRGANPAMTPGGR